MKTKPAQWSKTELKAYVLLLCANADKEESQEEIELIASKVNEETFAKMHSVFSNDTEEKALKKIQKAIAYHEFSAIELSNFKKEVYEVFLSDKTIEVSENNIAKILDNILY